MKPIYRKLASASLLPLMLSACGGDDKAATPPVATTPTVPPTGLFQDRFGAGVSAAFAQPAQSDPKDPTAADVPALTLTADPLDN